MKQLFYLLFIAFSISLVSCNDDFLERSPYGGLVDSNMWTTDNLTDLGVSGVYNALKGAVSTKNVGYDLYQYDKYSFTGQQRDADGIMTATATPGSGVFKYVWKELYEGVYRANDAIYNIPLKSPSTPEKKARYVAECKFLRAHFYFRLNQLYKGVPVYLEPILADECTNTQETEEQVWNIIINDLTDCIAEPELPNKYVAGDAAYGHVTKGAAYALRGKVYLYKKEWQLAADDFAKVAECGYKLFPGNYKDLFKEANEQCDEMIFSQQNIGLFGFGTTTQFYCGTRSSFGSCWNTYLVSPNLVDIYEYTDGQPFKWEDVLPGYNDLSITDREVYFLRDTTNTRAAVINKVDTRLSKLSEEAKAYYLPSGNEERLIAAYQNRDSRLNATVIVPYAVPYKGALNGADHNVVSRWPYVDEAIGTDDLRTDTQTYFYYLYRKFVYEGTGETPARDYCPIDFPIIRYADVLLMRAEALMELSKLDEAIDLMNQVRARAGVANLQTSNASLPTYVTSQDNLRNRIRNERRVEFPNEGINFFDEVRWKTWKETTFGATGGGKLVWGSPVTQYKWLGDQLYTWPVPQEEVQINPNLKLTPGWVY